MVPAALTVPGVRRRGVRPHHEHGARCAAQHPADHIRANEIGRPPSPMCANEDHRGVGAGSLVHDGVSCTSTPGVADDPRRRHAPSPQAADSGVHEGGALALGLEEEPGATACVVLAHVEDPDLRPERLRQTEHRGHRPIGSFGARVRQQDPDPLGVPAPRGRRARLVRSALGIARAEREVCRDLVEQFREAFSRA